jgi:hypothetical protein
MTITIGLWIIPTIITFILLGVMFRPDHSSGDYNFGAIFRLLWLIPIFAVWMIYMGLMLWLR